MSNLLLAVLFVQTKNSECIKRKPHVISAAIYHKRNIVNVILGLNDGTLRVFKRNGSEQHLWDSKNHTIYAIGILPKRTEAMVVTDNGFQIYRFIGESVIGPFCHFIVYISSLSLCFINENYWNKEKEIDKKNRERKRIENDNIEIEIREVKLVSF